MIELTGAKNDSQRVYLEHAEKLPKALVSKAPRFATIVGMRFYDSFDRITEMSGQRVEDQRFFLVREPTNKFDKNAVMLHDGVKKLGHVAAQEAIQISKIINELISIHGEERVLIATTKLKNTDFLWSSSFSVEIIGHVYERHARKFGQSF